MKKNKLVTGVKTSASNTAKAIGASFDATKAKIGASVDAGKAKIGASFDAGKAKVYDTYAKVADKFVTGIQDFKAQRAIAKYQGGGASASHRRTRYISDIKNNRRRLYDRERKIIQSIRNFENNNNNNNNNNRHKSRHHKTRKLRNILMRR